MSTIPLAPLQTITRQLTRRKFRAIPIKLTELYFLCAAFFLLPFSSAGVYGPGTVVLILLLCCKERYNTKPLPLGDEWDRCSPIGSSSIVSCHLGLPEKKATALRPFLPRNQTGVCMCKIFRTELLFSLKACR